MAPSCRPLEHGEPKIQLTFESRGGQLFIRASRELKTEISDQISATVVEGVQLIRTDCESIAGRTRVIDFVFASR